MCTMVKRNGNHALQNPNGSKIMDNVNANDGKITIYGENGQIVSVIAKDNAPMPRWTRKANTVKGTVLNAQGKPASVSIPVTYDKGTNGPVTVHNTMDKALVNGKALDPRAITERLQADATGNPYSVKASTDNGTSGEGKENGALYKFRKGTLQCALWQLFGAAPDLHGKVRHVSAMDKRESAQILTDNEVTVLEIEAMIFTLTFNG